jgi:hypothetical protein
MLRATEQEERVELSRVEVVGAWLRLWTPPRDAMVPPVPWRKLAIGGAVLAVLIGGALAFAIPRIDKSKEKTAAHERAGAAKQDAAERRRIIHDQRATLGSAPKPSGHLSAAAELRARADLLRTVQSRITRDARHRATTGEIQGRALRTQCVPAPSSITRRGADQVLSRTSDAYDCLAVTSEIKPTATNKGGELGYPFHAVINFRRFTFAWCKTNPQPGERAVPDPRRLPLLPSVCQGP